MYETETDRERLCVCVGEVVVACKYSSSSWCVSSEQFWLIINIVITTVKCSQWRHSSLHYGTQFVVHQEFYENQFHC